MLTPNLLDWRSSWYRAGDYDYDLFAGADEALPRLEPQRYVWRWLCQPCERFYLSTCGAPAQPCPDCGQRLARVGGVWDLREQRTPKWWRSYGYEPEDRL